MKKLCPRCKTRPINTKTGYCRECKNAYTAEHRVNWHKKNPTKRKQYRLKWKYNLTEDQFLSLLEKQNFSCGACKDHLKERPVVDHCHQTGSVRGLLCRGCNLSLGLMHDDPSRIIKLAEYLVRSKESH